VDMVFTSVYSGVQFEVCWRVCGLCLICVSFICCIKNFKVFFLSLSLPDVGHYYWERTSVRTIRNFSDYCCTLKNIRWKMIFMCMTVMNKQWKLWEKTVNYWV